MGRPVWAILGLAASCASGPRLGETPPGSLQAARPPLPRRRASCLPGRARRAEGRGLDGPGGLRSSATWVVGPLETVLFFDFGTSRWLGSSVPFVVLWLLFGAVFFTVRMNFINFRGFWHAIRSDPGRLRQAGRNRRGLALPGAGLRAVGHDRAWATSPASPSAWGPAARGRSSGSSWPASWG